MKYGIKRYNQNTATAMSSRDVEILAFEQAIRHLRAATDPAARLRALDLNQKLWSAILRETGLDHNDFPPVLRGDLAKLAVWATRYSVNAMLHGVSLKPLIDVNQDVLEGLQAAAARSRSETPTTTQQENPRTLMSA